MPRPRILVVDDSSTVRIRLSRVLTKAGYEVLLAASGSEGLRQARQQVPQLVILDIQMPDLDGYAVCDELKQMGSGWEKLPILFLTSLESHALALLGSQMGAYLQKPVRPEALLKVVAELAGPGGAPVAAGQAYDAGSPYGGCSNQAFL